jgi:uncharacterized protein (TIGR02271 family)
MSHAHEVLGSGGLRAFLDELPHDDGHVTLRLEDGRRFVVPSRLLRPQANGSYRLDIGADELAAGNWGSGIDKIPIGKIAVVEETARINTFAQEKGSVVVHVTSHEEARTIDVPLDEEHVQVKRFAVNRIVDAPVSTRQEGDTTIVPVVEEVLVVQKQLMLREEIHIVRKRTTRHERRQVVLRREEAQVLRADAPPTPSATTAPKQVSTR